MVFGLERGRLQRHFGSDQSVWCDGDWNGFVRIALAVLLDVRNCRERLASATECLAFRFGISSAIALNILQYVHSPHRLGLCVNILQYIQADMTSRCLRTYCDMFATRIALFAANILRYVLDSRRGDSNGASAAISRCGVTAIGTAL